MSMQMSRDLLAAISDIESSIGFTMPIASAQDRSIALSSSSLFYVPGGSETRAASRYRVLVIRGAGQSFCSGLDLKDFSQGILDVVPFDIRNQEALFKLENLNMITIAALHGHAIGGGLQIDLRCDLRIGSDDVVLSLPAVKEGIMPGLAVWYLQQYIGKGRAKRMIITGERIQGKEAYDIGLIDYRCPASDLNETVARIATTIAKETLDSTLHAKHMINRSHVLSYPEYMREYASRFRACVVSPDHRTAKKQLLEDIHQKNGEKPISRL